MRATCPDCLARAQAESEATPDLTAQRYADVQWVAKADRVLWWVLRIIACGIVAFVVWCRVDLNRRDDERERAKAAATTAKHRTHAPEMAPL